MAAPRSPVLAFLVVALAGGAGPAPAAGAAPAPVPDIPFEKHVLPNGLTLIIHEDRKAPIVAVNVWYHVGSKDEKRGKTGFAHLFEHLMFNGSEHFDDDYFKALEKVGATSLNGTTSQDRTNYFQNVPASALDLALFLESDRMGYLLGAVSGARLDEQRGVVQNEKRLGENQPYGLVGKTIAEATYPAGHPYSWTVIGSMEDLDAATLDDVRAWFRASYGPSNAVLVVAGDVDSRSAKAKVEKWFCPIPPGPPVARPGRWIAKMAGTRRGVLEDRVPQARLYSVWNVPEWGSPEAVRLDLAAAVLGSGEVSRLHKRLVHDDGIATDVSVHLGEREIGSQFSVQATVRPGGDPAAVERAIDEEMARFLAEGPTAAELERVKAVSRADFIRGAERIGGFGGKSDILATNAVFAGDPGFYRTRLAMEDAATPDDVRGTAAEWLADGRYVLEVRPFPALAPSGTGADRSRLPEVLPPPAPKFPAFETATLPSGLKLFVVRRPSLPLVRLELLVDAGSSADPAGAPGTASLAMAMLDEGAGGRSSLEIGDALDRLGARLSTDAGLETCSVTLSSLKGTLDEALEVFADVVLRPDFPEEDFRQLQKRQLAGIAREKVTPVSMALRALPGLLYGTDHPYGRPFTGTGTEEAVAGLSRQDLASFHRAWFAPGNAALIVVGDTTLAEIRGPIEALFAGWKAREVPAKRIPAVEPAAAPAVWLIDRPGSQQSVIFAGQLAPPKANPDEDAIGIVEDLLGGSFTSRINMNLREDKHWSYGARTMLPDARGQRPLVVVAQVQGDKTRESMAEIAKELGEIVGERPITAGELAKAQGMVTLSLPGKWETDAAVGGSLAEIIAYGLPLDHWDVFPGRIRALGLDEVNGAARRLLRPRALTWVVVGDLSSIEAGIRALGIGAVRLLDADGRPVPEGASR